jgi:L-cysteine desulfidase
MERNKKYTQLLKEETALAVGCTEPIAIALACAKAKEAIGPTSKDLEKIELNLSRNIIKNALGVGIPGTQLTGIPIAAALGYTGGDASKALEVVANVTKEEVAKATQYVKENRITINQYQGPENLYIEAIVTVDNRTAAVIIRNDHTQIEKVVLDGKTLFQEESTYSEEEEVSKLNTKSLADIFEFAQQTPLEPVMFILEGARLNRTVAEEGLIGNYGLQVGKSIKTSVEKNLMGDSIITYGIELASAASDARMAGCNLAVLTNSGSGNQGITVSLPVMATAEKLNKSEEELHRALLVSNLAAIHARKGMDRLTAMCGAFTAGIGASCGITYLLGGDITQLYKAVQNMVANLTGMVCDGAKDGCALKIASVVEAAFRSALMATNEISIATDKGINEDDVEKSLRNLVRIGNTGMTNTDKVILDIMVSKGTN